MNVAFIQFDCRDDARENQLALALQRGILKCGDRFQSIPLRLPFEKLLTSYELNTDIVDSIDADIVAMVSIRSHEWFKYCLSQGRRVLFFDKGYHNPLRQQRGEEKHGLWRVCVDAHQPVEYLAKAKHSEQRWQQLFSGAPFHPWRAGRQNAHIVVATSLAEYSGMFDLPGPTEWAEEIVTKLRHYTHRPIYYRPKPGWKDAVPIHGTTFCRGNTVAEILFKAHVLITYTSYITLDAMLYGVPSIVLGNAVTRPISSTLLSDVECPRLAADSERLQLLANLAWCQYLIREYSDGFAWRKVRELFL